MFISSNFKVLSISIENKCKVHTQYKVHIWNKFLSVSRSIYLLSVLDVDVGV